MEKINVFACCENCGQLFTGLTTPDQNFSITCPTCGNLTENYNEEGFEDELSEEEKKGLILINN